MSDPRLRLLLDAQTAKGGVLPLRDWMQLALYDEQFGYYARNITDVGPRGDFSTVPTASPFLVRCISNWHRALRKKFPILNEAPFVEIGGGGGDFAHAFRKSSPLPFVPRKIWLVETSPALRTIQKSRLGSFRTRWFQSPSEALSASGGKGIFFCNELVDAFPCSVFQNTTAGWKEVALQISETRIDEVLLDSNPDNLPPSSLFASRASPGQRIETHESFREWLAEWSPLARPCALLLIDYPAPERRPPGGTLRAYWKHRHVSGGEVFARFGMQDLTADVHFPDLLNWLLECGWTIDWNGSLANFLHQSSVPHSCRDSDGLIRRLLDTADIGGSFEIIAALRL